MQVSAGPQHWQAKRQGVSPGLQVSGAHVPPTHDSQSPHAGEHVLGTHS